MSRQTLMKSILLLCGSGFCSLMLLCVCQAHDSPDAANVQDDASQERAFPKFGQFAAEWSDDLWVPREARRFPQHIRSIDDTDWQLRMLALHEVVSEGKEAVPFLIERLQNGEAHERILAAQALGYLAKHTSWEPLLAALRGDEDPAVQLYAADALGMRGDAELAQRWADFGGEIRNRDVRRHMGYAEERGDAAIEDAIVERLTNWDPEQINSAEVGQPAPEFELSTVGGETVKLSDFREKKNVVLVFIYGDT